MNTLSKKKWGYALILSILSKIISLFINFSKIHLWINVLLSFTFYFIFGYIIFLYEKKVFFNKLAHGIASRAQLMSAIIDSIIMLYFQSLTRDAALVAIAFIFIYRTFGILEILIAFAASSKFYCAIHKNCT